MFYDYKIEIYRKPEDVQLNDYGVPIKVEPILIDTVFADVQPSCNESVKREYGLDVKCVYRVFMDTTDIRVSDYIKYNNKMYEITALVPWDYLDIFMDEVKL